MRVPDHPHFAAGSPVGRYWLAHGEGFAVVRADGHRVGVVEELVLAADGQSVERLVVRRRGVFGRFAELEATAFTTVLPRSRVFVLAQPAGRPRASVAGLTAGAVHRSVPLLRSADLAGQRAVHGVAHAGARAAAAARPRLARLGSGVAAASRAGARGAGRGTAAGAGAVAVVALRARDDAPRLAATIAAWTRATSRAALVLARALGRYASDAAHAAGVVARRIGRFLGDVAVAAAVVVADAWRGAAAARQAEPQFPVASRDAAEPPDADEPLARDADEWPGAERVARRSSKSRHRVPVPGAEVRQPRARRRS